jgi:hypothetical protein
MAWSRSSRNARRRRVAAMAPGGRWWSGGESGECGGGGEPWRRCPPARRPHASASAREGTSMVGALHMFDEMATTIVWG